MYEMRIKEQVIEVARMVPNPWNHNEQTDFMQERLGRSLERYGQVAEIIVREKPDGKFEIIDGEHRYKELVAQKVKKALVNNLGVVSDDDARLLTVVMNELRGDRNPSKLSRLLNSLKDSSTDWGALTEVLPFTPVEMENILAIADDLPKPPKETDGEGDGEKRATAWVDIKLQVHQDELPEVQAMIDLAKEKLKITKEPDSALENGRLLKVLLGHGGGEYEAT